MEAYCFKCKAKRELKNPKFEILKSRKAAYFKGICPVCGTPMAVSAGNPGKGGKTNSQVEKPLKEKPPKTGENNEGLKQVFIRFDPKGAEALKGPEVIVEDERRISPAEARTDRAGDTADEYGVSRRIYLPYFSYTLFSILKSQGVTRAENFNEWLVECIELAMKHGYRRRIILERVLEPKEIVYLLKEMKISREELETLRKVGYISDEEYKQLMEEV